MSNEHIVGDPYGGFSEALVDAAIDHYVDTRPTSYDEARQYVLGEIADGSFRPSVTSPGRGHTPVAETPALAEAVTIMVDGVPVDPEVFARAAIYHLHHLPDRKLHGRAA